MRKKIYLLSAGPGGDGGVPAATAAMVRSLPEVYAFSRNLPVAGPNARLFGPKLDDRFSQLRQALARYDAIGLIVTGDPTNFSLSRKIQAAMPDVEFEILPGAGARTALFAAFKLAQESPVEISGHGRTMNPDRWLGLVATNHQVLLYCDREHSPAWAQDQLVRAGLAVELAVGCNLCWPDQQLFRGTAGTLALEGCSGHSLVLTVNHAPRSRFWPGLDDTLFRRGALPMTKKAIRAAAVCALAPLPDSCCWDVGSGTGSVSVELALSCPMGHVWALEREPEGRALARDNARAFGVHNLTALEGTAPEALTYLPLPDRVFVGGSGGRLEDILAHIANRGPDIRVCVSAVTLETACSAGALMKKLGYRHCSAVTLAATNWRLLPGNTLAQAENPVTLWVGTTGGEK